MQVFVLLAIGTEWERHDGTAGTGLCHRKHGAGVAAPGQGVAVPTTDAIL